MDEGKSITGIKAKSQSKYLTNALKKFFFLKNLITAILDRYTFEDMYSTYFFCMIDAMKNNKDSCLCDRVRVGLRPRKCARLTLR